MGSRHRSNMLTAACFELEHTRLGQKASWCWLSLNKSHHCCALCANESSGWPHHAKLLCVSCIAKIALMLSCWWRAMLSFSLMAAQDVPCKALRLSGVAPTLRVPCC